MYIYMYIHDNVLNVIKHYNLSLEGAMKMILCIAFICMPINLRQMHRLYKIDVPWKCLLTSG